MVEITTCVTSGVTALPVTVLCDTEQGAPELKLIGCGSATDEIRAIVRCAMRAQGFCVPKRKVTVQVTPDLSHTSKRHVATAVATAMLVETEQVESPGHALVFGELRLDGRVDQSQTTMCKKLAYEQSRDYVRMEWLKELASPELVRIKHPNEMLEHPMPQRPAFAPCDVPADDYVIEAISVAIAGRHRMLVLTNETDWLERMRPVMDEMLPRLAPMEELRSAIEFESAHEPITAMPTTRVVRPSVTLAGMVGGGRPVTPGEVTLASDGVLALEQLHEFPRNVISGLRRALDDKSVTIVRTSGMTRFRATPTVIATARPCPCGTLGDDKATCLCSPHAIMAWRRLVEDPLGFDMVVDARAGALTHVDHKMMRQLATRVANARMASDMNGSARRRTPVEGIAQAAIGMARNPDAMLGVAMTIADMGRSDEMTDTHLAQALSYAPRR